jgi:hypothetical protein
MFAAPPNQNPYELDRLYWRFFFAYQKVTQLKEEELSWRQSQVKAEL